MGWPLRAKQSLSVGPSRRHVRAVFLPSMGPCVAVGLRMMLAQAARRSRLPPRVPESTNGARQERRSSHQSREVAHPTRCIAAPLQLRSCGATLPCATVGLEPCQPSCTSSAVVVVLVDLHELESFSCLKRFHVIRHHGFSRGPRRL